jgi:D-glycero-D-manno-heptose 1,7-bisphosphate phosphatase
VSAVPRAAVFLDRDGVLVRARVLEGRPYAIRSVDELELEQGAREACDALRAAGFVLVVVTNQPEVARGTLARSDVDEIHARLAELLPLDEVVTCPHDDADGCACRKPRPGMLLDAASRLGIDLAASYAIGDRWRDIEAARRAGCTSVFLDRGYSEPVPERPDVTVRELRDGVSWILAGDGR